MVTISEKTPPIFSYENILKNPLTTKIFEKTLSQLGIQDQTKFAIINEFKKVVSEFADPTYTGDIEYFKINLYTTLTETNKKISLVDVLSTEEFVDRSTEMIENLIYIQTNDNKNLTLEEYIRYYSKSNGIIKKRPSLPDLSGGFYSYSEYETKRHHILPVLRGLYRIDSNNKVSRDTSEIVAALKKHIITHTTDNSTQELSSLVEKSKKNKDIIREDEVHYNTIKSYIESLPKNSEEYPNMIKKIKTSLEYFSNSIGYKKEKLDKLMFDFLKKIANKGLSLYNKYFGYLGSDVFSIELKQKLDINELVDLIKDNNEYKNFLIKNLENKKEGRSIEEIKILKENLENFMRPSRKERVSNAPYRGAPIKSDQEYGRELGNLRLELEMEEKNLELIESYIKRLQNIDTTHNSVYHEIDDMPPEEKIRP